MIIEVKNRNQIANAVLKKIGKREIEKRRLAVNCDMSRNSVYKILQSEGKEQNYTIDMLIKICKELGIKIYLEF